MADFFDFLNKIQTEYPAAIPILSAPGVMAVYQQAIDQNWPPERLQAALEQTEWWKTTPQSVRQWQALQATDPATASTKAEQTKRIIDDLSRELGIHLDSAGGLDSPSFSFFTQAVANGWDANEIRYRMLSSVNATANGGSVATQAAQVKGMADDYGVPMSDQAAMDWGHKLLQGISPDAVKGYVLEQAKSRFPGLTDALDRGVTVRQYADSYLQILKQETGANTATMSMADPKILAALDQVDPKTGQHYSMTLTDWTKKVRSDPAYGYDSSQQAHQQVASLATNLAQKMGSI